MSLLKQAFFVVIIVILSHSNFFSLQSEEKTSKDNTLDNSVPTTAKRVLKLGIENDVILLSDREYTHGTRLEYGQYEFLHSPSAWIFLGLKKLIPVFADNSKEYNGYALTQKLFTPQNTIRKDIAHGERPYAGYMQASSISTYWWKQSSFTVETGFGEIGSNAGGEYFQSQVHKVIGATHPQGWKNQIPNKTIYQLNLDYKYFWIKELGIQTTVKIGNFDTSASLGPIFRFGKIVSPVSGGFTFNDPTSVYPVDDTEYYFFIKPEAVYQSWNGTLQAGKDSFQKMKHHTSADSLYRYAIFDALTRSEEKPGFQFLIFNTLFNAGNPISNDLSLLIARDLTPISDYKFRYPTIEYFLLETLLNEGLPSRTARSLAYSYLLGDGTNLNNNLIVASKIFLQNSEGSKHYAVPIRNFQGKLTLGFALQRPDWFIQLAAEISTLDYIPSADISLVHRYASLQAGLKF
ncbi:lipid A-modifier LpxR family protein [Leptospira ilyithenensis]|uniref:Lipid A deacylase LpxR family protein n=1 Tax=Leptospira ilyithenensis TaxID=2484901 RepID=A0A4V3JWW5_9LEPT|nr:lipid A-modifier LpxR family protein [Leptospira ilyithenensis]TGN08703.1 lipid A deacylase LpxR family protein [Leptospira ilyithenensis]